MSAKYHETTYEPEHRSPCAPELVRWIYYKCPLRPGCDTPRKCEPCMPFVYMPMAGDYPDGTPRWPPLPPGQKPRLLPVIPLDKNYRPIEP